MVDLLAEGVDRNQITALAIFHSLEPSPASRRAWIEIGNGNYYNETDAVALLAEGVDRNLSETELDVLIPSSPSSRRAWIEILC